MLFQKKKQRDIRITGMHCEKCVGRVLAAVKSLGGGAAVDLKLSRAHVTLPESVSDEALLEAIRALGFEAEIL